MNTKHVRKIVVNIPFLALAMGTTFIFWRYEPLWFGFFSKAIYFVVSLWLGVAIWIAVRTVDWSLRSDQKTIEKTKQALLMYGYKRIRFMLALYYVLGLIALSGIAFVFIGGAGAFLGKFIDRGIENAVMGPAKTLCQDLEGASSLGASEASTSLGKIWIYGNALAPFGKVDLDLERATSLDELDTVICVTSGKTPTTITCTYSGDVTLRASIETWRVRVVDWKTKRLIADTSIQGERPICPERIESSSARSSDGISGAAPSSSRLSEWLLFIDAGNNTP